MTPQSTPRAAEGHLFQIMILCALCDEVGPVPAGTARYQPTDLSVGAEAPSIFRPGGTFDKMRLVVAYIWLVRNRHRL